MNSLFKLYGQLYSEAETDDMGSAIDSMLDEVDNPSKEKKKIPKKKPIKDTHEESEDSSGEIDSMFDDVFNTSYNEDDDNIDTSEVTDDDLDLLSVDGSDTNLIDMGNNDAAYDELDVDDDTGIDDGEDVSLDMGDEDTGDAGESLDIDDHVANASDGDSMDVVDSPEDIDETVDPSTEIKRKNKVRKSLRILYNNNRQYIDTLIKLDLPPDKAAVYKPLLDEYVRLCSCLDSYIKQFCKKDTSFVQIKSFLEYRTLFNILDSQMKRVTDEIFPDKKNRK